MLVERPRGQVGLTIGPFPGKIEASHKIHVTKMQTGLIRIKDTVRLQRDTNVDLSFCGVFECIEKCFLPSTDDYIDQVLSSMARLRFLVENGEATAYEGSAYGESTPESPLLGGS
jgi:hypothetical protein